MNLAITLHSMASSKGKSVTQFAQRRDENAFKHRIANGAQRGFEKHLYLIYENLCEVVSYGKEGNEYQFYYFSILLF